MQFAIKGSVLRPFGGSLPVLFLWQTRAQQPRPRPCFRRVFDDSESGCSSNLHATYSVVIDCLFRSRRIGCLLCSHVGGVDRRLHRKVPMKRRGGRRPQIPSNQNQHNSITYTFFFIATFQIPMSVCVGRPAAMI